MTFGDLLHRLDLESSALRLLFMTLAIDEVLLKAIYLALMHTSQQWTMPLPNLKTALDWPTMMFEERMPIR